jgi:putative ATP-dependent endonuclease of the OLD family
MNDAWPRREGSWSPADFAALRGQKKFSDGVRNMLRQHCDDAPARKAPLTMAIVTRLERPNQVPQELRDVFARLRQLAG